MIYLYAFTDATAPDVLADGSAAVVRHGRVAAVLAAVEGAPEPDAEALWRHEAVVESLPPDVAVLPARFGTVLADEAAVRALLGRHEDVLAAALDRVRGHVEIGVRMRALRPPAPAGPPPPAESGRAYLERRRGERHELVDAAEAVHEELRGHARAAVSRRGDGQRQLLVGAYLVPRDGVDRLVDRIRGVPAEERGLQLLSTGPWPPYHFAPVLEEVPGG